MLSKLLIRIIRLYQLVAPASVRERCRFDPSCSNYAILALEKYGVWKGLQLIVDRLQRCCYPNEGEDFP
ncbi:MAG: hypothetical protein COB46_05300 [Rhodospirillaceae bacterium]|nr:MAG: hypothetical protein COB46_05300 [Rhodospirillaceae bacterium]